MATTTRLTTRSTSEVEAALLSVTTLDRRLVGRSVHFEPTGLLIKDDLDYADWEQLGAALFTVGRAHSWWIGDWWAYGEARYGERASQVLKQDEMDFQTFANMGWVARRIETSRRREVLSWSHHAEVAARESAEQDRWLDLAETEGWTREQLRTEIRKAKHLEAERLVESQRQVGQGAATVVEQDALDFLAALRDEGADLLLTDPPYMTDVPDIAAFAASWVPLALSKVKSTGRAYICTGPYPEELRAYLSVLLGQTAMSLGNVLVWTYRNTLGPSPTHTYKANWQAIFYLYGRDAPALNCPLMNEQFSVQDISAPDGRVGDRYHAWQKPEDLAERLIRHSSEPGAMVVDPFAGTGTFLKVAAMLGRFAFGADVNRDMLKICAERGVSVKYAD